LRAVARAKIVDKRADLLALRHEEGTMLDECTERCSSE
jgi:hypothetical protein